MSTSQNPPPDDKNKYIITWDDITKMMDELTPGPTGGTSVMKGPQKPILGWRGWALKMHSKEAILVSPAKHTEWSGPVLRGPKPSHASGFNNGYGEVGIYSLKYRPKNGGPNISYFENAVFGQVEVGGQVVEHEWGYRSEIATVRKLYLQRPSKWGPLGDILCRCEIIKNLAERYQCDVEYKSVREVDMEVRDDPNLVPPPPPPPLSVLELDIGGNKPVPIRIVDQDGNGFEGTLHVNQIEIKNEARYNSFPVFQRASPIIVPQYDRTITIEGRLE